MSDLVQIDGSLGEGGGQVLRTALALALVTRTPIKITNIRAGRKKPGLLSQHLASVNAAVAVSQAEVRGNAIGSGELYFSPQDIRPGSYHFAVGTAGSCTLVLQTVLPALSLAGGPSELTLEGGTHNPFAPPFDFLAKTFLPLLNRMGPTVMAALRRPGFYPAGGGKISVSIMPVSSLTRIDIPGRDELKACAARAMVSRLPRKIAERELAVIKKELAFSPLQLHDEEITDSPGPGNVVSVEVESEHVTEVFTAFGRRGVPAEEVALEVVAEAGEYLSSGVPVGKHLADQLLIPMALAGGGSFRTLFPTRHTATNIEVIRKFLSVDIEVGASDENTSLIEIKPI